MEGNGFVLAKNEEGSEVQETYLAVTKTAQRPKRNPSALYMPLLLRMIREDLPPEYESSPVMTKIGTLLPW